MTAAERPWRNSAFSLLVEATRWPADLDRLRQCATASTDWDRFVALVERHRVVGLAAFNLRRAGIAVPGVPGRNLSASAAAAARTELVQVGETLSLARQFAAAAVGLTVLKGPTIAFRSFGRFGLRSSVDLDLLVDERGVSRADALLRAAGYRRIDPAEDMSDAALRRRNRRQKDMGYQHETNGVDIELHWRLFANPQVMRTVDLAPASIELLPGHCVSALSAMTALLYMAVHGTEHSWARLKWLADLAAELARDPRLSKALYAAARPLGLGRSVGTGLMLAERIYDLPVPAALARVAAGDWRQRALLRTALLSLVGDEEGTELEDVPKATTRKNLSHYLLSSDPRQLFHELAYDMSYRGEADVGRSRLLRMARRLLSLVRPHLARLP